MKTSDIVVGAVYKHTKRPNNKYLGVKIPNFKYNLHRKTLIITQTDGTTKGHEVIRREGSFGAKFWDGFYLEA